MENEIEWKLTNFGEKIASCWYVQHIRCRVAMIQRKECMNCGVKIPLNFILQRTLLNEQK